MANAWSREVSMPCSRSGTLTAVWWNIRLSHFSMACGATLPAEARTVAFAPDGRAVLGEGYDGRVRQWSLSDSAASATAASIAPTGAPIANWLFDPLTIQQRLTIFAEQQASRLPCTL